MWLIETRRSKVRFVFVYFLVKSQSMQMALSWYIHRSLTVFSHCCEICLQIHRLYIKIQIGHSFCRFRSLFVKIVQSENSLLIVGSR